MKPKKPKFGSCGGGGGGCCCRQQRRLPSSLFFISAGAPGVPVCGYGPRGIFLRKLGTVGVSSIFLILVMSRSGLVVDHNHNHHPSGRLGSTAGPGGNVHYRHNQDAADYQEQDQDLFRQQEQQHRDSGGDEYSSNDEVFDQQQQQRQNLHQHRSIENDLNSFVVDTNAGAASSSSPGTGTETGTDTLMMNGSERSETVVKEVDQNGGDDVSPTISSSLSSSSSKGVAQALKADKDEKIQEEEGEEKNVVQHAAAVAAVLTTTTTMMMMNQKSDEQHEYPHPPPSVEEVDGVIAGNNTDNVETAAKISSSGINTSIKKERVSTTTSTTKLTKSSPSEAEEQEGVVPSTVTLTKDDKDIGVVDASSAIDTTRNNNSDKPRVCSHQLLNPPPRRRRRRRRERSSGGDGDGDGENGEEEEEERVENPVLDGSLEAMTLFWEVANVTCYDIDVIVLKDGSLLATHPNRLRTALTKTKSELTTTPHTNNNSTDEGSMKSNITSTSSSSSRSLSFDDDDAFNAYLKDVTLDELRTVGITSDEFPLLDEDLLPHFATLLRHGASIRTSKAEDVDRHDTNTSSIKDADLGGDIHETQKSPKTLPSQNSMESNTNSAIVAKKKHDDNTTSSAHAVDQKDTEGDDAKISLSRDGGMGGTKTVAVSLKRRSLSSSKTRKQSTSHRGRRMLLEDSLTTTQTAATKIDGSSHRRDNRRNVPRPSALSGPHINLDLKQGPHLTKDVLKRVVEKIYEMQLEEHVAICVTPMLDEESNSGDFNRTQSLSETEKSDNDVDELTSKKDEPLDMLRLLVADDEGFHPKLEKNQASKPYLRGRKSLASNSTIIQDETLPSMRRRSKPMLGLVLRDLVDTDRDVERIKHLVEKYPDSIRLLVPSFKFQPSWYRRLGEQGINLPITAWTIDSDADFDYASRMKVSAVIANTPLDFVAQKP